MQNWVFRFGDACKQGITGLKATISNKRRTQAGGFPPTALNVLIVLHASGPLFLLSQRHNIRHGSTPLSDGRYAARILNVGDGSSRGFHILHLHVPQQALHSRHSPSSTSKGTGALSTHPTNSRRTSTIPTCLSTLRPGPWSPSTNG